MNCVYSDSANIFNVMTPVLSRCTVMQGVYGEWLVTGRQEDRESYED